MRPIIYQLFVRHFSNTVKDGVNHGSIEQNGCGKFDDVSELALKGLADLGVTHIWLTGILRHATQTAYSSLPAQEKSIVKGLAGSPYAVVDYFDVDPDLAHNVDHRMTEFQNLIVRCRRFGLIPIMDFIPNHVSRAYFSSQHDFGQDDDHTKFFEKNQGYYYLTPDPSIPAPPLKLPDGYFSGEMKFGRVTGNNAVTWEPSVYDWYETVKLNYGYNFKEGLNNLHDLPHWLTVKSQVPKTWQIMDDVLTFWQNKGIGGFRCDMAHMIPMEFWKWSIARARVRQAHVLFIAEAYNDHMKTSFGDPFESLVDAGFVGVYDSDAYNLARRIYDSGAWANDFDRLFERSKLWKRHGIRYVENHDEVRVCAPQEWQGVGEKILPAMMTLLYCSSSAPILLYNGQEVGEKAQGPGGFGGGNGRTSIFDYTCLPQLQMWVNEKQYDGQLMTDREVRLRTQHQQLLKVLSHPALAQGDFYGLNWANTQNMSFGREPRENSSGHWIYAMLRRDIASKRSILIVCNLSPKLNFYNLKVNIPQNALAWCQLFTGSVKFNDMLSTEPKSITYDSKTLIQNGFECPLPPGLFGVWELVGV